jgi:arabinofuranan 3-O-arabinosyltransferase
VQLAGPLAAQVHGATATAAHTGVWSADHREVDVTASPASRVLVVPESINPGWTAHAANGAALTPVTVNGWQQGWVVPPGTAGPINLEFASNTPYRVGLFGGLALLPLLALLAWLPIRRPSHDIEPARQWRPAPVVAGIAVVAVGFVISGPVGAVVVGACLALRRVLPTAWSDRVTIGATAGGLILAGAVLSVYPWRSVEGYLGHSWGVQLLALVSVGALAASAVPPAGRSSPGDGLPREEPALEQVGEPSGSVDQ